jgi:transposase-like protein
MHARAQKSVSYSDEFKAEVLAEYALGASVFALHRKYGVGNLTIDKWVAKAGITRGGTYSQQIGQEISSMVTEYMKANLRAMIAVADHVSNEEWLMQQSAEGLALVTSTLHDKTVHLLSSMQANADAARLLQEQEIDETGRYLLPGHPDYVDPETLGTSNVEQAAGDTGLQDSA